MQTQVRSEICRKITTNAKNPLTKVQVLVLDSQNLVQELKGNWGWKWVSNLDLRIVDKHKDSTKICGQEKSDLEEISLRKPVSDCCTNAWKPFLREKRKIFKDLGPKRKGGGEADPHLRVAIEFIFDNFHVVIVASDQQGTNKAH